MAIAIDPIHTQTMYLTGGTGTYTSKSTDGGASWTPFTNLAGGAGAAIVIDPVNTSTVYVSGPFGLSETTNGGTTWTGYLTLQETGKILIVNGLALDPANPSTVYAGAGDEVYKSPGFTALSSLGNANAGIEAMIVDAANPATIYAATYDGVYVSNNSGQTWLGPQTSGITFTLAMEPNPTQMAAFQLAESAVQQLIADTQNLTVPPVACGLLQVLADEMPTLVQFDILSSTQAQALLAQITPVLQAAPCK
jgi:hypothetical protein